jgi:hypothetical protein
VTFLVITFAFAVGIHYVILKCEEPKNIISADVFVAVNNSVQFSFKVECRSSTTADCKPECVKAWLLQNETAV